MKKNTLTLLSFAFSLFISFGANAQETYSVDTEGTEITWKAEKVTGSHVGTVTMKSGSIEMTDEKLTGGTFTVDMSSIEDTDLEGEWKTKLENHLKSDDFFGVEKYPTATFTITDVKEMGENKYRVGGNMTIKGETNRVEFEVTIVESDGTINASGTMVIDRSKYNVRYGSGTFFDDLGDKTIYDNFDLGFKVVAEK